MKYFIIFIMSMVVFGLTGCDPDQWKEEIQDEIQNYDPDFIDLSSDYYPEYQDDPTLTEVETYNSNIVCFAIEANEEHPALRMYFFRNRYLNLEDFSVYEIQYTVYKGDAMNRYPMDQWFYPVSYSNCLVIEFKDGYTPSRPLQVWLDGCVRFYAQSMDAANAGH